jgi:23S rRNA (guanine1835-N2)-methyltransferase
VETLELPGGPLRLQRWPRRSDDLLRAWDAADEYLLNRGRELLAARPGTSVLIVNDAFGALGTALATESAFLPNESDAPSRLVSWSDSHLGLLALEHNLDLNGQAADAVTFVPADRDPEGPFDLVILKFPKSLGWWEDLLLRLRPSLHQDSLLLGGGMIKHSPARIFGLLESVIGPTETSKGWKKARLATTRFDADRDLPPCLPEDGFDVEQFGLNLRARGNVFSRAGLDLGTRVLLEHLPATEESLDAADLGCGNGVLALALARNCPQARILGVDESYQAVAGARQNAVRSGLVADGDPDRVRFEVADGLADAATASLDLVVCNPPFHQGQSRGDQVAWEMFRQARRALRPTGRLMVVGNRHLGYHWKLKRLFPHCDLLGSHPKFVVLVAY